MTTPPSPQIRFIFQDRAGLRWNRLRIALGCGTLLFLGALLWFVQSLFVTPDLRLPENLRQMKRQITVWHETNPALQNPMETSNWLKFYQHTFNAQERQAQLQHLLTDHRARDRPVCLGFYVDWDPESYDSLVDNASHLTHVCPEWMTLNDSSGNIVIERNPRVLKLANAHGVIVLPLLTNLVGDRWQPEAVENLARGSAALQSIFLANLLKELSAIDAGGVVIDWQDLDPAGRGEISTFLTFLAQGLHRQQKELWLSVPVGREFAEYDLGKLSGSVDRFIAQLHDENADTDAPGPVASQDWFDGWLRVMMGYGQPRQWIISIGAYGYDWQQGKPGARMTSFADVMSLAGGLGLPDLASAPPTYNPHLAYRDEQTVHQVWFLDVGTFLNQARAAQDEGVGGLAIYRLGTEDRGIWPALDFLKTPHLSATQLDALSTLAANDTVSHVGTGEFISVELTTGDGQRHLQLDERDRVRTKYEKFPLYATLYHRGGGDAQKIALTFDDGPDPRWTPKILDILKARQLKATFFLIGKNVENHPALVRRILAEGHAIGNHTYSHPNLSHARSEQVELELNATQRLIETVTGRSTTLFRPPYNADSRPRDLSELKVLKQAEELGYIAVCENIDPEDWERPGTETILQRIKQSRQLGNIILLHDAGGDRSQTVEALPKIIDYLLARGDNIVPLSELIGIPNEQLMPLVRQDSTSLPRTITGFGFQIYRQVSEFLWAFMIVATALLVVRSVVVAVLAIRNHHWEKSVKVSPDFTPALSILVAAYNEEKVIAATLRSILSSRYQGEFEIIVIDDGSSDQTSEVARTVAATDARVRTFHQTNTGKAGALRYALGEARHNIVVFIDADTQLQPEALSYLIAPFQKAVIGAVSGQAKVGNTRSFIGRCQALEYMCGFNLDRRAYDEWNCITVIPGAISAARRASISRAGGLSDDTLAEDTDLTLNLHRLEERIVYAPKAIAYTEAPETVATLARQRFRWAYGTMQCLWKHRDMVLNPRHGALGLFSLPSIWFCQILLVALFPLIDLLLLLSLFNGVSFSLMGYFFLFLSTDFALAVLACGLEGEPWHRALRIIPMRFIYRPLLSWVVWKSLYRATCGAWVGWGKLERKATVRTTT